MGANPSGGRGDTLPVENVSWYEAVEFCNKVSQMEGLEPCYTISGKDVSCDFGKNGYRLPTEAEWEYAAKGGTQSRGYMYAGGNDGDAVAWYNRNSGRTSHPVGTKNPNELGLFDMSGNVSEWCWDRQASYVEWSQTDPRGQLYGLQRVMRGGSWGGTASSMRASARSGFGFAPDNRINNLGFRVARRDPASGSSLKIGKATIPEMVSVEGGTFQMGDTFGDGLKDEKPVHAVTVSSFSLGKYEVRQKEWIAVMGSNPGYFEGDDLPMEVSWLDAVSFCNRLSSEEGLQPCYTISGTSVSCDFSRNGYRLPIEAEWEYAAKGGRLSRGYKYAGGNDARSVGWYGAPMGYPPQPVGGLQANELGLYDMSGNVWEWCWDKYGDYSAGSQTDPRGPTSGSMRVMRSGTLFHYESGLRVSFRGSAEPGDRNVICGFRLARSRA